MYIDTLIYFILCSLFIVMYFKVADRYNIIDKPNQRSSHTQITLRGGGIVFPFSVLLASAMYASQLSLAQFAIIIAMLILAIVSFWDDIQTLSSKTRFLTHLCAVTLLLYGLNLFAILPFWAIPVLYIGIIGILNFYNFMDGINGITGVYSLSVLGSLFWVQIHNNVHHSLYWMVWPLIIACLVFLFFNFRKKAKCFAGDVGSVCIGFLIISLLLQQVIETGNYSYFMFLAVYNVDATLTIIQRAYLKQNIFEAHRLHLYQKMANEFKIPHLWVSLCYGFIQLVINFFVIISPYHFWINFVLVFVPLGILYLVTKFWILKNT